MIHNSNWYTSPHTGYNIFVGSGVIRTRDDVDDDNSRRNIVHLVKSLNIIISIIRLQDGIVGGQFSPYQLKELKRCDTQT